MSNGGTEAINLLIEKTRRLAHGFRNFNNYRLRILLVADGNPALPKNLTHERADRRDEIFDAVELIRGGSLDG